MQQTDYKKVYETIVAISKRYSLLKFWGIIKKNEYGKFKFDGFYDDNWVVIVSAHEMYSTILNDAFLEYEFEVKEEGKYSCRALLEFHSGAGADIDYNNYYVPQYIEATLQQTMAEIIYASENDLPF